MKKITTLIYFAIFISLSAQTGSKSQSIELPDFVITGKQKITMPKVQKKAPDFIPLLSKDFFNPALSNEDKIPVELPEAKLGKLQVENELQKTKGFVKIEAGHYVFPKAEIFYGDWINNFTYSARLFGLHDKEYVDNSGITNYGANLSGKYFVKQEAKVLPGLEMGFNGNFRTDKYKFFGSLQPELKRENNLLDGNIYLNYTAKRKIQFGLNFNNKYFNQNKDTISENIFGSDAFIQFKLLNMDFRLQGSYKNQTIGKTRLHFGNTYYFNTIATVNLNLFKRINIKGGIYVAESNNNTFFSPIAYGSLKLANGLTVFGEFSPFAELKTMNNFMMQNRYYRLNNFVNTFTENKVNMKFAVRFEYDQYFELNGGFGYLNSDNDVYFTDEDNNGFFDPIIDDTENTYVFLNALFRKGPAGEFYGELKIQDVRNSFDQKVPYVPSVLGLVSYRYNFTTKFGTEIQLDFHNGAFIDADNTKSIPEMYNLSLSAYYTVLRNLNLTFTLENLLDNKYYYYNNYKAKPFDIYAGFQFRW